LQAIKGTASAHLTTRQANCFNTIFVANNHVTVVPAKDGVGRAMRIAQEVNKRLLFFKLPEIDITTLAKGNGPFRVG
jgi:SpoU rRNA methylase family enzyme